MRQFHALLSLTITATTALAASDLVGFDDGKITADDAPVKGVAQVPASIGLDVAATAIGIERVKASGAISAGDDLVSAAAGGVQAADETSVNIFATALTDAADGEWVEILIR